MKLKLEKNNSQDCNLIRKSAEHSIMASNTVNPIIALVEVTRGVQILESLHNRYGPTPTNEITNVDTIEMLNILQDQKNRILEDVTNHLPNMKPVHPLTVQAGYGSEQN